MFRIEKKFTFPMGHRLSKHKGACVNFHGHNYNVMIGLASPKLNKDDMVIDFSHLKKFMNPYIEGMDHCLMINSSDEFKGILNKLPMKIVAVDTDPTAERMAEQIFFYINDNIKVLRHESGNDTLFVEYVTVYETDGAKATYSRG